MALAHVNISSVKPEVSRKLAVELVTSILGPGSVKSADLLKSPKTQVRLIIEIFPNQEIADINQRLLKLAYVYAVNIEPVIG